MAEKGSPRDRNKLNHLSANFFTSSTRKISCGQIIEGYSLSVDVVVTEGDSLFLILYFHYRAKVNRIRLKPGRFRGSRKLRMGHLTSTMGVRDRINKGYFEELVVEALSYWSVLGVFARAPALFHASLKGAGEEDA